MPQQKMMDLRISRPKESQNILENRTGEQVKHGHFLMINIVDVVENVFKNVRLTVAHSLFLLTT